MFLICGLGNPGKQYEKTRHNAGFTVIDGFQKKNNFPDFEFSKKDNSLVSKGELGTEQILIAKPQTFMNNSGRAVKRLMAKYDSNLVVVHDDVDLPLGSIRISIDRGAAGHKGVESIIKELKTKDFVRLRIGISGKKIENRKQKIEGFVLQKFSKNEEKIVKEAVNKTVEAIETMITEGLEKSMAKYNQ